MKTSEDYEREFIQACEEKTGRALEAWMAILKDTNFSKLKETTDYLKTDHGVTHMNAGFIAGIYLNGGKPVYDTSGLFNAHFEKYPDKRPMYDKLEAIVKAHFPEVQVVGTKGYISFRNKKEFAVAKINKGNMRIGMDLGDRPFDDAVEKAKSLGTMPRISHMVEVTTEDQVTDNLLPLLQEANSRVNG